MKRAYWLALLGILLVTCIVGGSGIAFLARFITNPLNASIVHLQATSVAGETVGAGWSVFEPPTFDWQHISGVEIAATDEHFGEGILATTDSTGRLWFPTRGAGLLMFDGTTWHNWYYPLRTQTTLSATAIDNDVYFLIPQNREGPVSHLDITTDRSTTPWLASSNVDNARMVAADTRDTLYIIEGDQLRTVQGAVEETTPLPCQLVFRIEAFSDGELWMNGGSSGGIVPTLCSKDAEGWHRYSSTDPETFLYVNAIQRDSQGRVWVTKSQDLLLRNTDGQWYRLPADSGILDDPHIISDLAVDSQDRLWLIMGEKLMVYNGDTVVTFPAALIGENGWWSGYEDHGHNMVFDQDGQLWIALYEKIIRFNGTVALPPFDIVAFLENAEPIDITTEDLQP